MWNTYYLKFADEAEAVSSLEALQDAAIDHVGEIVDVQGWHVNLRLRDAELPEGLVQYQVFPETPVRMWA